MTILEKAKALIMTRDPFFSHVMTTLEFRETNRTKVMATDGILTFYNPKAVEKLGVKLTAGVIIHELYHILFKHHIRQKGRNNKLWNYACDYAINPLVIKAGYDLPTGALIDRRFAGMTAEIIYEILKIEPKAVAEADAMCAEGFGSGGGEPGEDFDPLDDIMEGSFGEFMEPEEVEEMTSKEAKEGAREDESDRVDEVIAEAKSFADMVEDQTGEPGNIPGEIEELIKSIIKEPSVDWREALARFLEEVAKNDYSWSMPNKRYVSQGVYLPTLDSREVGKLVFAVDTSGSVSAEELNEFANEMRHILSIYKIKVVVVYCDTRVTHTEEMDEGDLAQHGLRVKGRGGTSFDPVFDYIEEEHPDAKACIYFTDGYPFTPPMYRDIPTIWAITRNGHPLYRPGFGETIKLK